VTSKKLIEKADLKVLLAASGSEEEGIFCFGPNVRNSNGNLSQLLGLGEFKVFKN
jgi:hypothetical protein